MKNKFEQYYLNFENHITGRWAISFRMWLYLSVIGGLGVISRVRDIHNISTLQATYCAVFVLTLNIPLFVIVSEVILKSRREINQEPYKVFSSYILLWAGNVIVESIFTYYFLDKPVLLGPQVFAPLFPSFFGLMTCAYLLAEFDSNRTDISRLQYAQEVLVNTAAKARIRIESERSSLIEAIQKSIFVQLDALKLQLTDARNNQSRKEILRIANELEEYSRLTIRSLSHEIANDSLSKFRIDRTIFIGQGKTSQFSKIYDPKLSVFFATSYMILVGGFSELSLDGWSGFLFNLTIALVVFPFLAIGAAIIHLRRDSNILERFTYFLLSIFVIGFIVFRVSAKLEQDVFTLLNAYEPNVIALRALTTIILTSLIMTLIEARRKTRLKLEEMNSTLNQELDWIESRSGEVRDEIASVLHGPLQGRIAGIALALRLEDENGDTDAAKKEEHLSQMISILDLVLRDVQKLFEIDTVPGTKSIAIKLLDLKRSWQGIVQINWLVDPSVYVNLEESKLETVMDIIYEAVSNAVRHGQARSIKIELEIVDKVLEILITDDGLGVPKDLKSGIGLRKISAIGASYSFSQVVEKGAQLIIKLPLA
jgi:signal transduction histidine kinase